MTDLTKIDRPFGELDRETKGALMLAAHEGATIEFYDPAIGVGSSSTYKPGWAPHLVYRIKPVPLTPDTLDWSQVAAGWDFCMRRAWEWEAPGMEPLAYLFMDDPTEVMARGPEALVRARVTQSSYRQGTCDWPASLIRRPGK